MKKIFAFLLFISILFLTSCNALEITSCKPIYAMDTVINIKFYNVNNYQDYYKDIKNIYNTYDKLADDFEEHDNNIYKLNLNRSIEASNELIELINYSLDLKEKTNGYFNPLVGRLTHLWKDSIKDEKILDKELINSELEIINSSSIEINDNIITIIGDANIDLGAIAKGYATYQCVKYLKEKNINGYLIDAGESSVALGEKGNDFFKVALEAPYNNKLIKNLEIKNTSVATSSGKHQNVIIDNVRYHHIINPFTGYPSNIYDNVNVIIDNPAYADCYSTAIYSMELDEAKAFIEKNDLKAILYKDDKIIYEKI